MPVSVTTLDALLQTPSAADFRASILSALEDLGFPVTSWEVDGVAYQLISVFSEQLSMVSLIQKGITSGGFLDLAAALKNEDGTDSTPWLDLLSTYLYATPRIEASFASGDYEVTNSNAFAVVLSAGDIRAVNAEGYTYTSATGGSVPAGGSLVITLTADQPGVTGTAAPNTITIQDGPSGLTGTNPETILGLGQETNVALAARCRAKLTSLSPNGAADAYAYFAPLATTSGGVPLGVTRTGVRAGHYEFGATPSPPYPGEVWVYAATASGPLGGGISPPYTSGACYELWSYLMRWCVPDAVRLRVAPATVQAIPITATIYVREPGITVPQVLTAIARYFATIPIGGVRLGDVGVVPFSAIIDTIHNLSPTVKSVSLTTPSANIVLNPSDVPSLFAFGSVIFIEVSP